MCWLLLVLFGQADLSRFELSQLWNPCSIIHTAPFFCIRCQKLLKGSTGNDHHSPRRGESAFLPSLCVCLSSPTFTCWCLFPFRSSLFPKTWSLACCLRSSNLWQMKCVVSCSVCPLSTKMEPCRYSVTHVHRHTLTNTHSRFSVILRPWLRSRPSAWWGGFYLWFL